MGPELRGCWRLLCAASFADLELRSRASPGALTRLSRLDRAAGAGWLPQVKHTSRHVPLPLPWTLATRGAGSTRFLGVVPVPPASLEKRQPAQAPLRGKGWCSTLPPWEEGPHWCGILCWASVPFPAHFI